MQTIIENHVQARATKHVEGVMFRCHECQEVKPVGTQCGTGYGYDSDNNIICYECCGKRDKADMIATGKATLYLSGDKVSNWPGTLVFNGGVKRGYHNFARYRYDIWFVGPDGKQWHGVTYGDNTQICHCRRNKQAA